MLNLPESISQSAQLPAISLVSLASFLPVPARDQGAAEAAPIPTRSYPCPLTDVKQILSVHFATLISNPNPAPKQRAAQVLSTTPKPPDRRQPTPQTHDHSISTVACPTPASLQGGEPAARLPLSRRDSKWLCAAQQQPAFSDVLSQSCPSGAVLQELQLFNMLLEMLRASLNTEHEPHASTTAAGKRHKRSFWQLC